MTEDYNPYADFPDIGDRGATGLFKVQSVTPATGHVMVFISHQPPSFYGPFLLEDSPRSIYGSPDWSTSAMYPLLGYANLWDEQRGWFTSPLLGSELPGVAPMTVAEIEHLAAEREKEHRLWRIAHPDENARTLVQRIGKSVAHERSEIAEGMPTPYPPEMLEFDFTIDYGTAPMFVVHEVINRYAPNLDPLEWQLEFDYSLADDASEYFVYSWQPPQLKDP